MYSTCTCSVYSSEMGECICPLSLSVHYNFVRVGRYSEKGHWFHGWNWFRHGIDSSCMKFLSEALKTRERAHVLDENLFQLLKLRFHEQWWLYSLSVPTRFLAPMAASKNRASRKDFIWKRNLFAVFKKVQTEGSVYIIHKTTWTNVYRSNIPCITVRAHNTIRDRRKVYVNRLRKILQS